MSADDYKRQAAEAAVAELSPGMRLGLGTGSTAAHFVDLVGARVRDGLDVLCVPTSEATRAQAERLGIPLTTLEETPLLNLTVDGADELDGALRLIKGGGGALLREKIVAAASERLVIIADHTKQVETLGAFALPVEVVAFGHASTYRLMERHAADAGCRGEMRLRKRADGSVFVTDGGNLIYDCAFQHIDDPQMLDRALKRIPGVVESGLFIGLASKAYVAGPHGVSVVIASREEDADV